MADERFDTGGTQPGLTATAPVQKTLTLKCRSPRGCNGVEATEVGLGTPEHYGQRLYRCLKCGHSWGVALGGHFEF
jgi:hypothetical protein